MNIDTILFNHSGVCSAITKDTKEVSLFKFTFCLLEIDLEINWTNSLHTDLFSDELVLKSLVLWSRSNSNSGLKSVYGQPLLAVW